MRIRPAIVIVENKKIMLMRYSYSGKDVYQFPGGNMEEVETLEQTLRRELNEELNLSVSIGKLLIAAQVINGIKQQATFHCLFEGNIQNASKPVINPEQTSALEVVWMETNQLDRLNLYPSVGTKLKELLHAPSAETCYLGLIEQSWF
jgi:8-oxo-dGTP diphosphatase